MSYPVSSLLQKQHHLERVAFICQNRRLTWQQCLRHIAQLAAYLKQQPVSRWVLICENAYAFCIGFFALLQTDKTIILPPDNQINTLKQLLPGAILSDNPQNYAELNCLRTNIFGHSNHTGWQFKPVDNQRLCLELFTSGSTGKAKSVSKKLCQLEAEIQQHEELWGSQSSDSVILSTVTHQHIYGLLFYLLRPLCYGRTIVSETIQFPDSLIKSALQFDKITLISSPTHLNRLPELIDMSVLRPHISCIFSSGAPLSNNAALAIQKSIGQTPVEVYGSTETGGIAYRCQNSPTATLWQCFDKVNIAVNPQEQTLIVQSPFLADEQPFQTSDIVSCLNDKQFILQGRNDRIIKLEGKRINLNEVEYLLKQHDFVFEAVAIKLSRHREMLAAAIVLTTEGQNFLLVNGHKKLNRILINQIKNNIEHIALPRYWRYIDNIPSNLQGKVLTYQLEQLFTQ